MMSSCELGVKPAMVVAWRGEGHGHCVGFAGEDGAVAAAEQGASPVFIEFAGFFADSQG